MKSRRTKACDISQKVKKIVWERDNERCIVCRNQNAMPNAHYIPRSQNGLGIEENVITLCQDCHYKYDQTIRRKELKEYFKHYLQNKYSDWKEEDLIYKKGVNYGK